MSDKNAFTDLFSPADFSKFFEAMPSSMRFDMQSFFETQRKNMQALTDAQKMAMESMQAIAARQTEIFSQLMEDNSAFTREIIGEGTPEEKIVNNAKIFKTLYERTTNNLRAISDLAHKSNTEAANILHKRVSATMNELQHSVHHKSSKKKAAA